MRKTNIAVIFGGCSPEYGVSLKSAYSVLSHMDRTRYAPIPLGISQRGQWFLFAGDFAKIENNTWLNSDDCTPAVIDMDRGRRELIVFKKDGAATVHIDAVFPVLHGKNGEDGTIQAICELSDIPLVGCGLLSSALCMDKHRAHILTAAAGVIVPRGMVLNGWESSEDILKIADTLNYPLFVKPIKTGSSYGVSRVIQRSDVLEAVRFAFEFDSEVIIEEGISGFEVGCAVMGNQSLVCGEVDEIELAGGFFDFAEKYTLKSSAIHVPARISREKAEEIKTTAKVIYRALNCRGLARVDMFLTPDGRIVFNEVNTIPGFTAHSRFPAMMKAAGVPIEQVITAAIELAISEREVFDILSTPQRAEAH